MNSRNGIDLTAYKETAHRSAPKSAHHNFDAQILRNKKPTKKELAVCALYVFKRSILTLDFASAQLDQPDIYQVRKYIFA